MSCCSGQVCEMPQLAFGTWRISKEDAVSLVSKALSVGYKHIDCAAIYENEEKVGEVFGGLENRKSIFIVSKLWSDCHLPEKVKPACEKTLKDLQLEYLDLYLVHNPIRLTSMWMNSENRLVAEGLQEPNKERLLETWRCMEKLVESGLCKKIGVSNFTTKKLQYILDEGCIKPYNNQVELHPYLPQNKLVQFCFDNGIIPSAYSPLGNPGFVGTPFESSNPILLKDPALLEVAADAKITPAQALVAWAVHRKTPTLVKSSSEARMKENLQAAQITLSDAQISAIDRLEKKPPMRYLDFALFQVPGFADFWDGE